MTKLEHERRRRGWNQTELAYHAQITQGEVSRIERRLSIPTARYAERVARALGLRQTELLEDVDSEGVPLRHHGEIMAGRASGRHVDASESFEHPTTGEDDK